MRITTIVAGLIVLLVLFMLVNGCGEGRFVSEGEYLDNLAAQLEDVPKILRLLRENGVDDRTELKLEYFFYTDTEGKARMLSGSLQKLGYSPEHKRCPYDKKLFLINGWTPEMQMNEVTVAEWVKKMCRLGVDHDSEFDGWGTNPNQ
jgi:hypothetical protein